jgi:hypothetical protein
MSPHKRVLDIASYTGRDFRLLELFHVSLVPMGIPQSEKQTMIVNGVNLWAPIRHKGVHSSSEGISESAKD